MAVLTCDVAVIGAGTAGLSAQRSARRAGARTYLIDPAFAGTTCATVGCMPSKLLIAAGQAAHRARSASLFGIDVGAVAVDGRAVMARVRRERDRFAQATRDEIATIPDDVRIEARARFLGPDRLALDDGREIRARAIVIATGSTPAMPEAFAALGERVLTNETIFEIDDLPRSLGVIGAGPLGLELAQAMARLGVAVTVFDGADTAGHVADAEVAARLADSLGEELTLHLGIAPEPSRDGDGVRLAWDGGAVTVERVLLAAGRPPALDGLGIETTGLARDDRGVPAFDRATMRCGDSMIFLCGDADGERPVLHEASAEGAIAGAAAASLPDVAPARRQTPFAIMFTEPALAVVGAPADDDSVVGEARYDNQGRARVMGENAGIARLYADPKDGRITGATLFAPGAEHLGHLLAWAIEDGRTASELLERPFYHPTLEEGVKPALRAICRSIDAPVPPHEDEGTPSGG